jgi:hypothetical protein
VPGCVSVNFEALTEIIIRRYHRTFRLQALKKTKRKPVTPKASDGRAALPLANNQQVQNAERSLPVGDDKHASLCHRECRLTGGGNKQTQPAVATSTTVCSGTTQARGSSTVPEVSACRVYVLKRSRAYCSNLQFWLWWQGATLAESSTSLRSVAPLLSGDACGTVSTVPASAPVDAGGGCRWGRKAEHANAARSKGNENRVGVPLSFAPAIGRTTSSGGNCFRFTPARFFIFLFICVLHFLVFIRKLSPQEGKLARSCGAPGVLCAGCYGLQCLRYWCRWTCAAARQLCRLSAQVP